MAAGNKLAGTVFFGVSVALAILGAGAIMAESEMTFINMPLFIFILLLVVGGIVFLMRKPLRRVWFIAGPEWLNLVIFDIILTAIAGGALLLINSLCADTSGFEETDVVVARKIVKTRHKTQTSGRRSYATGPAYHEYYLELSYPDGREMEIKPPYKMYKNASEGDSAYIKTGKGALFMRVCDPKTFRLKHPPRKHRKRMYGRRNQYDLPK